MLLKIGFRHADAYGRCVKAVVDATGVVWSKTSCSDATGTGYVCQSRQRTEDIGEKFRRIEVRETRPTIGLKTTNCL